MARVLIVDDSRTMRGVVRRGLTLAGLSREQIIEAHNGVSALEALRTTTVDLIVSDVNMPEMGGEELLSALKANPTLAQLPVVMITSVSSARQVLELVRKGASKVIRKPFDPQSLPDQLSAYLPAAPAPVAATPANGANGHVNGANGHANGTNGHANGANGHGSTAQAKPLAAQGLAIVDEANADHLWASALDTSMAAMLERMAFAEIRRVTEETPDRRIMLHATIPFEGFGNGAIRVACALDTARSLAESMMGDGVDIKDDSACLDTVAELANILAGDVLRHFAAESGNKYGQFRFGLPVVGAAVPGDPTLAGALAYRIDESDDRIFAEVAR